jgi:hypothetical protein
MLYMTVVTLFSLFDDGSSLCNVLFVCFFFLKKKKKTRVDW